MHFITQSIPDIQRKLQKPEPGPQTLVGEAFKHSNNRDLTEEVNKDKRLIKKTASACSVHPSPPGGPGGLRRLDRPPRSRPVLIPVGPWSERGTLGRENVPSTFLGYTWGVTLTSPSSLQISWMRDSCMPTDEARAPAQLQIPLYLSSLLQWSFRLPSMCQVGRLSFL